MVSLEADWLSTMRCETVAVGCHRLPSGPFEPCGGAHICGRVPRVVPAWLFLKKGRGQVLACSLAPPLVLPGGWLLISFLALLGCTPCRWELSRFLISIRGRQAAKAKRELAGTEVRRGAGWKRRLRESICQAAIRILRATAALAALLWRERWPTST